MPFWIGENLGTCSMFELTERGVIIVDVRDLSDYETDIDKVREKMELIAGLTINGRRVMVRCVAGINRSNVLACAALCLLIPKQKDLNMTWNHHWEVVRRKVPRAQPTQELIDTVKKALWQTGNFKYWKGKI